MKRALTDCTPADDGVSFSLPYQFARLVTKFSLALYVSYLIYMHGLGCHVGSASDYHWLSIHWCHIKSMHDEVFYAVPASTVDWHDFRLYSSADRHVFLMTAC